METIINNKRIQEIQLISDMKLYINIRNYAEQEIDIYFGLQSQNEENRSITIELTNFKDKNGKDIITRILGVKLEDEDNSYSHKFTIEETEIIKLQFVEKALNESYDFNEVNFDIIIGKDIYPFMWNYQKNFLTKK